FRLRPADLAAGVCADFGREPEAYGRSTVGAGRTIVIDYSSPNIAKPFSVGHLRSTIIGQALHNVLSWLGYRVIGDNHLGDWGTQFGKLLCAFDRWGDEAELRGNPTAHLLDLYVRFHNEARADPNLEPAARDWFRRLETGDSGARARWQHFVELSTAEFSRIYDLLGVRFDAMLGESSYEDRLSGVVERALGSGVAREEVPPVQSDRSDWSDASEPGAKVVLIPLDSAGIKVPLLLRKSDGTSLYATREIATAEYRIETWQPEKMLYVVGNEQEFYFRQFNAAMKLLGREVPCVHVNFGLVRLPEGRMSTREGRVVFLEDVISEAIRRAEAVVTDRDLSGEEKKGIARKVGIGAIKYADLSQNRIKEVVFDWNRMLSLDGDSAPYLMYACTRTRSILRKAGRTTAGRRPPELSGLLTAPEEQALLKHVARFPDSVVSAADAYEPHRIAGRLYRLAQDFSTFYSAVPVLKAETDELRSARLYLVEMTGTVLRLGLGLLGIEVSERM
ncbi:arginine--tRNA ligase, partial [candidate division WOR-3 bacterium]|nr:arginine--tRNA ligase [candidate division WOR-3 bacterium]